jgi:hypothetical protein
MLAGCPPAGGVLLAQRLLLLLTASPISLHSNRFELNNSLCTRWHDACFSMRACAEALSRRLLEHNL